MIMYIMNVGQSENNGIYLKNYFLKNFEFENKKTQCFHNLIYIQFTDENAF